jgi:hypothetical protein
MSSKRIYQQFIRKTASEGKSIVAWDKNRRYEGIFKSFDSTGEFVVLSQVWVSEGDETIFVSEMLLPLDDLSIVSAGLPVAEEEPFAEEEMLSTQEIYPAKPVEEKPAVKPETVVPPISSTPSESQREEKVEKEEETRPGGEARPEEKTTPPPPKPLERSEKPEVVKPAESLPNVSHGRESAVPVAAERKIGEPAAKQAPPRHLAKPKEKEESELLVDRVKTFFSQKFKMGRKVKKGEARVAREIPPTPTFQGSNVQPRPTHAAATKVGWAQRLPRFPTRAPVPKIPPQVIQRKSAQVSASSFFSEEGPSTVMPPRRLDIGTLILDILIGLLTLVAIAIVVMGFLRVKLPFSLPF